MDAKPFRTAERYLAAVPLAKWSAIFASAAGAVLFVLLLPLIFLTIDHLIWKGRIPALSELTPSRQQAFRQSHPEVAADSPRVVWEKLWQEKTSEKFRTLVGDDAARAYIEEPAEGSTEPGTLTGNRLGLLSLLARERMATNAAMYGWLARNFPWTWQPDAVGSANTNYLTGLFIVAVIILLLHALCMLAADYFAAKASLEVGTRLRRTLYAHSTRLGLLAAKPATSAEAADLFTTKVETIQDGLRAWLRPNIAAPVVLFLVLILLFAVNPWLTLCFVLAGLLVWLVLGQYAARFARESRLAVRRSDARTAQMRESLGLLQLVKGYLMDRFSQTRLERQLTDYNRAEWRRLRGLALSRPALMSAVTLTAVGMLYLAGRNVLFGQLSMAALATKIVAIAFLVWSLRWWIAGRIRIRKASDAAAALGEFLERRVDSGQPIDAEFLQPLRKKLEVVEVSVREPGSGRMLLDGVSFGVPAGARVGVVASDAEEGRALMAVLSRFLEPTGGEIRFDGKNTRWVTLESLRTQVALIAQPHTVFTDTVLNNIGCGDPSYPPPQIIDAAKLAHAHQFVQKLPYGYETIVGDGGYALRAGEKMRIALARALLRDPSLLIVEEPPEAMDVDSQTLLDDTLERSRSGRTQVFVTRRESVLRKCDHIVVLHKARVDLAGDHEALLDGSDLYRRLVFKELAASA